MDYQVFLVTRMREAFVHGATAREAVVDGFRHGARVVTAAATIMMSVFAAFMLQRDALIQSIGFALAIAPRCEQVIAVDISADAVARIRANAAHNGRANVDAREMNAFDELRELERTGAEFDTIVLDPPAFAKNKGAVRKALSGYKEINLRALKLLRVGGYLVTCSCSYNVTEPMFLDVVSEAATDAGALVALVEKRSQGRDHPILLNVPETYYLKCLILRKIA